MEASIQKDPENNRGEATPLILPEPVPPAADIKHCRFCREPIARRASVCKHCRTDLSPVRRYLTLSNTTLALLTALIAVTATSAPAIKRIFTPDTSLLTARFVNFSIGNNKLTATFLVTNDGRRLGVVGGGILYMRLGRAGNNVQARFDLLTSPPMAVGPGDTSMFTLNVDVAHPLLAPDDALRTLGRIFAKLQEAPKEPGMLDRGVFMPELDKAFCGAHLVMWNSNGPRGQLLPQIPCEDFAIIKFS